MSYIVLNALQSLVQQGLDMIFPPCCAGCSQSGSVLCSQCLQSMQPSTAPACQHCGLPLAATTAKCLSCQHKRLSLAGLRSVHIYQGALRQAIHALKYRGQQRLAEPLGLLMVQAFHQHRMHADSIIPLPLHAHRQQERGYNQAALLARICATHLKVPCLENIVIRQRDTRPQVGLTFQERQQNVRAAFSLTSTAQTRALVRSTILLIDDVSTTGATLEACADPLYAVGVREVWGLVLGRPSGLIQDAAKGML